MIPKIAYRARARTILKERKKGKTQQEIADDFNLSQRSVSRILRKAKNEYKLDENYKSSKAIFFEKLRNKCREMNGLTPSCKSIDNDDRFRDSGYYMLRYGPWSKICKEAGLKPNRKYSKKSYNPEFDLGAGESHERQSAS